MRAVLLLVVCAASAATAPGAPSPIALTEDLGVEIDASEQARYHLFPGVEGFVSARFVPTPRGAYQLYCRAHGTEGHREHRLPVTQTAFEHTRTHALLVERYLAARDSAQIGGLAASCTERSVLLLASRGEYDAAARLASAALLDGEDDPALHDLRDTALRLAESPGLFRPGSLYDRSGRTELLVFSGYYGLWLGIATPIAARADNAAAVGLPLLVIPTASVLITGAATRTVNVSDGRAGMIILGGHLGTWQGLGWATVADRKGYESVRIGALAGLVGIGASTVLTGGGAYTPGHAEIANAGLPWGAWLGAVAGVLADHEGDDVLRDMLIGSNLGVAGCVVAGRDSPASRARVRLCTMAGVLGAVGGFALDLIFEVDDAKTAMGMMAAGSLAGLYVGWRATASVDRRADVASLREAHDDTRGIGAAVSPRICVYASSTHPKPTPSLEVALRF